MADFESARRYLLKAYRQKTQVAVDRERIEADLRSGNLQFPFQLCSNSNHLQDIYLVPFLRSAIRLCKLQDMCCSLSPDDIDKQIRLYEQMGDSCSSMKAYPRAIDFYQKMLKEASGLGWSDKNLNPIYVSLSQTYMDVRDYKNAITFYKKEMKQYSDNPSEVSTFTLINNNAISPISILND